MYKLALQLIFIIGIAIHIFFMQLNQVLIVPDSFAYLQMAHHLGNFSSEGFGTGWFGFLYSLPIAIVNYIITILPIYYTDSLFLSAQIVNIILFFISGVLAFKVGERYLDKKYNLFFLVLFFLSSTLIHFNINILSENLFLPLFLGLILALDKFIIELSLKTKHVLVHGKYLELNNKYDILIYSLLLAIVMALLYYTRSESFIYILSLYLILFILFLRGDIGLGRFTGITVFVTIAFTVFVFPYVYHLHTITGGWGLTNKGTSNIRQAEMRGIDKMDDAGFEKAVGELTADKHHLIGGFAGGLKYDKPETEISIIDYISENRSEVFSRFLENQKKLYLKIVPGVILGNSIDTYNDRSFIFYKSKIFFIVLLLPTLLFLYGGYRLFSNKLIILTDKKNLILIGLSLFLVASVFFTLFFVLERYFIVFVPLGLIVMLYGLQEIFSSEYFVYHIYASVIKYILLLTILVFTFILGDWNYFTYNSYNNERYQMKIEMGHWIRDNHTDEEGFVTDTIDLNIMERFPISTYYSGTKNRWLVPYTDNLEDLVEYAKFNEIDYMIVDTFDFSKYRPDLDFLIDTKTPFKGLDRVHFFEVPGQKVILYKIQ